MKKTLLLFLISIFSSASVFAYAVKVYDEMGNRVGTYRKEGDKFVLYDFNDKKVENPETLIQNAPSQKTLTQYSQYLYDENMNPIGSFTTGFYGSNGRYYPRGFYYPKSWNPHSHGEFIVRPATGAGFTIKNY
ncbi:hypothetical protein IJ750_04585 [bacterium]|nr:hypothetical protein [bacterium]